MMIDTPPWSSCSCQSPWLPCFAHTISSAGRVYHRFGIFCVNLIGRRFFEGQRKRFNPTSPISVDYLFTFLQERVLSNNNNNANLSGLFFKNFFRLSTSGANGLRMMTGAQTWKRRYIFEKILYLSL